MSVTLKIPELPTNAILGASDTEQINKNIIFNKKTFEITKKLQNKINVIAITWCRDGCIVLAFDETTQKAKRIFKELKYKIVQDKPNIRHTVDKVKITNILKDD